MKVTQIMNRKNVIKPEYKQKFSFILLICSILLIGYFAINLFATFNERSKKEKELENRKAAYQEQADENARLQSVIDGGDQEEYIRQTAREKLGFVIPGEKVYYNVTPKN